jgi:hypothetical protein
MSLGPNQKTRNAHLRKMVKKCIFQVLFLSKSPYLCTQRKRYGFYFCLLKQSTRFLAFRNLELVSN